MGRALPAKVAVERRKVLCIMCCGGKVLNVRSHPTRIRRRRAYVIIRKRHLREIAPLKPVIVTPYRDASA